MMWTSLLLKRMRACCEGVAADYQWLANDQDITLKGHTGASRCSVRLSLCLEKTQQH